MSENSVKTFGKAFSEDEVHDEVEFVFFGKTFKIKGTISSAFLLNIQTKIAELVDNPESSNGITEFILNKEKMNYIKKSFVSSEEAERFFKFIETVDDFSIEDFNDLFEWIIEQHTSRPTK